MTSNKEHFWDFISRNYDINLEIELFNKSGDDFVVSMLGGKIDFFKYCSNNHVLFLKVSGPFVETSCVFQCIKDIINAEMWA